jgi:hypothetical protein
LPTGAVPLRVEGVSDHAEGRSVSAEDAHRLHDHPADLVRWWVDGIDAVVQVQVASAQPGGHDREHCH